MNNSELCATCDSKSLGTCLLVRKCPFWAERPGVEVEEMRIAVKKLHEMTGVGSHDCRKAIEYCKAHPDCTPMGYLRAKAFAVATPKLSFYERVRLFDDKYNSETLTIPEQREEQK